MKIILGKNRLTVLRENGKKIYNESFLLHLIKKELIKQGHDVIKKRMWKDGHLYGDTQTQYIRTRNKKTGFMVYDGNYALRFMYEDYNAGELTLLVEKY